MSDADTGEREAGRESGGIIADLKERFRGFPVPTGAFEPATVSPGVLRKYGLPPRPDPERQPLLRQTWDRAFGASLTLQKFVFTEKLEEEIEKTPYRLYPRQANDRAVAETRFETSRNWSGAYITANRDKQFLQIWGVWTIPDNLKLPQPPFRGPSGADYVCSNWIGLDGQRQYLDSSLPQVGTVSTLPANGGATTAQAWVQWWARQSQYNAPLFLSLAVTPGDQVMAVLTALDAQTVIFVIVNLSTKTGMAVKGSAPTVTLPGYVGVRPDIAGATAEWILERPAIPRVDPPIGPLTYYNFPDYGDTEFDSCVAVEGNGVDIFSLFSGSPQELQGARRIRMFDVLTDPQRTAFISMPRKLNNTTVDLRYGSF